MKKAQSPLGSSYIGSAKRQYDWQRFWIARTGMLDLSDGGFLADPTGPLHRSHPATPATLAELEKYRALVLLGEPGIGKSTTLEAEAARVSTDVVADRTTSIHVDLRAYSSDTLLHQRVFGSPEFIAWTTNTSHLVLHLDSLDEALLRIDSIANLLASELPRYPASRMSLRIACRTAVWPGAILEPVLNDLWGADAVGIFELAPLRRKDVVTAAGALGVDANTFIRELYAADVVPFAIKPLTLNLLLGLFQRDGRLPRSLVDLYTRGCLKLCEETNSSRRNARRLGTLNPAQRLRVAGRLAAATMFANRYAVWTGIESDGVPEEDVAVSVLACQHEEGDLPDITQDHVREVLDTGLFTSHGGELMGWAHQSFAEFLAAQYLVERKVSSENVLKILLHPSGGLVPQLAVVAAWIASLSKQIRDVLIASEPLVLLRGDLTGWSEGDIAALVASLLTAFECQNLRDFIPGIADYYAKLAHPHLATQLRPYIIDSRKNLVSRRGAIMMAGSCDVTELQPELLQVALDPTADPELRTRAVSSLQTCGDQTVPAQILVLAKGELGSDPNDGIRGHALEILWPKHLCASELFAMLAQPNEGYVGAYVMFLTHTLPESLAIQDLPVALRWATSFVASSGYMGDFHRKSLADSILFRGWANLENSEIVEPLLDYVFACLQQSGALLRGTGHRAQEQFREALNADVVRRRRFIRAAVKRGIERMQVFYLVRAGFIRRDDFFWLLGQHQADMPLDEATLCNMVEMTFDRDDPAHFERLYETALQWPLLWQHFLAVFEGVPLDSADAQMLRKNQEMMKEFEERRPSPLTPPPAERIETLLTRFEAGEWRAWWQLNRELTLAPASTVYGSDLEYAITGMAGWIASDEATRLRILRVAEAYLNVGETSVDEWIGTNKLFLNDLAAYRAFILMKELEPAIYGSIPLVIWQKWAPAIAGLPKNTGSERPKLHAEVVVDALSRAPAEFVGAIKRVLNSERAEAAKADPNASVAPGVSFHVLRELEGCWESESLKQVLLDELRDPVNSDEQFRTILEMLLSAKFTPARDHAIAILSQEPMPSQSRMLVVASVLAKHCVTDAWPAIQARISQNAQFARSLFLDLASNYRFEASFFAELEEQQIAEIYVLLHRLFPVADDPKHNSGEAHFVGPHEMVGHLRDGLISLLVSKGTHAAVHAMRWTIAELPKLVWLPFLLRDAEQTMRIKTWAPLSPSEVFRLTESRERQLVQTPADLCGLLTSALRKYEAELHGEQSPVRSLWDRQGGGKMFRPVEEDSLSDHVSLFLRRELVDRGIVANREVEVGRIPGAPVGKRTDIRVDAIRRSDDGVSYDTITAVIETKGCWNAALFTALENQLYEEYLVRLRAPVGIYIVGWFDKDKWDDADGRKAATSNATIHQVQTKLDAQADAIPAGFLVRALVLDCHAH
ncbi:NACHT domain-containing protein [Bradyrhizobium sp. HKCCYLS20291]|uniref:NACHT domain-containing protein n=1 Tax=Bradyrhizobium sp. HKCCYLS20291 TaxID=3420766 RepID=UPI003EB7D74A